MNSFSGDGSTVAFSLSSSPDLSNTLVYIDGVYQVKAAYSISGQVLTLSAAPDNNALIEIIAATVAPVQESTDFLINNFTGNNSTTAFSLSSTPTSENQCSVFISGVYQSKANFSVSGSTLTFSTPPPSGSAIEVMCARTVVFGVGTPDDNTVSTVKIQDDAVTSAKVDSTVATVAGTETLTNKTLTAPDINTPDIDGGTIDGAVIGGATAAAGTFTGLTIDGGGSIGVVSTDRLYIATADGLGLQFDKDNNRIIPCDASGGANSNVELGDSGLEFTNLWLSGNATIGGGVYLGGTGAANKLDSYEEGSFNPYITASGGNCTNMSFSSGVFTKVGRLVTLSFNVAGTITSGSAETSIKFALPFNAINSVSHASGGTANFFINSGANRMGLGLIFNGTAANATSHIYIPANNMNGSGSIGAMRVSMSYLTT